MSDDTITLSRTFFKELDQRLIKIFRKLDQIDILAHDLKSLSKTCSEIDTVTFSLRQQVEDLKEFSQKQRL